jgi:hypothetical protein
MEKSTGEGNIFHFAFLKKADIEFELKLFLKGFTL